MENDLHGVGEHLTPIQKQLNSSQVMWCIAPMLRESTFLKRTPDDVRTRGEAAAGCTGVIGRGVLKEQGRRARAQHLMRCCLAPYKRKASGKPLGEFHVAGHFTDRGIVKRFSRIRKRQKKYRKKEWNIFDKEGTSSLQWTAAMQRSQLQARAKLSDNKVTGPEDAVVSEMVKILLLEKICMIARYFQDRFMG